MDMKLVDLSAAAFAVNLALMRQLSGKGTLDADDRQEIADEAFKLISGLRETIPGSRQATLDFLTKFYRLVGSDEENTSD